MVSSDSIPSKPVSIFKEMKPLEPFAESMLPSYNNYYNLGEKGRIVESDILRDLLYVFQGIDGRFLKFNSNKNVFELDSTVIIPKPTHELVLRLAELGGLFHYIQNECQKELGSQERKGLLIEQSFYAAIKQELTDYYRLITILENELFSSKSSQGFPTLGLSLKRLFVWSLEPLQKLRMISSLMEQVFKNKNGGSLLSILYQYLDHGDPNITNFILKLLSKASVPFFTMLYDWIYKGELVDPFNEFCIKENKAKADVWRSRYSLCTDKIPAFIPKSLVKKVDILIFKNIFIG